MAKLPRPQGYEDGLHMPPLEILAELGRISIVSAGIEDILHGLWWQFSRAGDVIGPIITEDMKPSRIADDLLKIGRAAKIAQAKLDDLSDIFAQYKESASHRNHFIHWIWFPADKDGKHKLAPPGYKSRAEPIYVTAEQVTKVADDLVWIEARLFLHGASSEEIISRRAEYGVKANLYVPTPWLDNNLQPIAPKS